MRTLLFLAISAVLVWGMAKPISRAQPANRAGIVVQFGDGSVRTACVDLGEDGEATGDEVLTDAGFDVIMEVSSVGGAVCKIGNDGCDYPGESCFCECEDLGSGDCIYWAYYHLIDGKWQYSNRGVTSYTVQSGDVEGWAWGPGTVGAGGVAPPVKSFAEVCAAPTATATASTIATATATATPSQTPEPTATATDTPAPTATQTLTPAPTGTPTAIPTATAVPSASAKPTQTPVPTTSAPPTSTAAPLSSTRQQTDTGIPVPTNTSVPPTETPTPSATLLASPTPDVTRPALATMELYTVTPLPTRWTRPTATSTPAALAIADVDSEGRAPRNGNGDDSDVRQYIGFGVLVLMLLSGLLVLQRGGV